MEIFGCEMDIIKYINEYDRKDYESILANDTRWEIFYNFSEMRKSILNWYDFKSDAKLLEIGGEYGALTGLFCENVKHVVCYESSELHCDAIKKRYSDIDNLEVTNDFEKALNGQYDYIVIIGGLERSVAGKGEEAEYVDFLKKIGNSLCEEGTLLLAVENRLGVKYFCGYKERYTNVPFAGINGYNCLTNGYTFSRAEIRNIIEKAKIGEYRFYYPLPDYKLTQLVYTDDNLPNNSIRDKVINYYVDKSTLVSCEDNLYDDIIANNALPFMANSFLIEISKNNTLSNVSYAALSTDRKKAKL